MNPMNPTNPINPTNSTGPMNRPSLRATLPIVTAAAAGLAIAAAAAWAPSNTEPSTESVATVEASAQPSGSGAPVYKVDLLHTSVLFRIRHGGVGYFWGRFNQGDGEFFIDEANPSASFFRATIEIASVDTNDGPQDRRDNHIRSADFLNSNQFPQATFESTAFIPTAAKSVYDLTGNFTLAGVTKPITARVEFGGSGTFQNAPVQGFEATFEFKRSDFGISTYLDPQQGESGALGNTIKMVIGVEGRKQ